MTRASLFLITVSMESAGERENGDDYGQYAEYTPLAVVTVSATAIVSAKPFISKSSGSLMNGIALANLLLASMYHSSWQVIYHDYG